MRKLDERARIAVRVPREMLAAVEERRRALGMTRSAVVIAALQSWMAEQSETVEEREYRLAYQRDPETDEERRDGRELAIAVISEWHPWDRAGDNRGP